MREDNQIIETQYTGDRFSIEKECFGGMGKVFIARRERDGKLYAIKTFLEPKESSWDQLFATKEQFKWESQIFDHILVL